MKKIILLLNVFALCLLASCNPNKIAEFDDKDAFVAFGGANYAIAEDGTSIKVPVTLASVKGLDATVTVEGVDGTAKAGVDYNIATSSLQFNSTTRTAYVEVSIINRPGEYTGDLNFTLKFGNLGGVNAGFQSTTTITINDLDHPLSFILGEYTASGVSYWDGPITWTMTLKKDPADDSKVWFDNIFGNASWAGDDTMFYGVVSPDKTTITIPLGQTSEYTYSNGKPLILLGLTSELNGYDSGNVIVTIKDEGKNLDFGKEYGFWVQIIDTGNIAIVLPGITATKK
ncbi:MAG: hypothetical protein IJB58_03840 [Bacteroidales bacterium]|nr:hypothetical protein [Bacteroidales bacterium]